MNDKIHVSKSKLIIWNIVILIAISVITVTLTRPSANPDIKINANLKSFIDSIKEKPSVITVVGVDGEVTTFTGNDLQKLDKPCAEKDDDLAEKCGLKNINIHKQSVIAVTVYSGSKKKSVIKVGDKTYKPPQPLARFDCVPDDQGHGCD